MSHVNRLMPPPSAGIAGPLIPGLGRQTLPRRPSFSGYALPRLLGEPRAVEHVPAGGRTGRFSELFSDGSRCFFGVVEDAHRHMGHQGRSGVGGTGWLVLREHNDLRGRATMTSPGRWEADASQVPWLQALGPLSVEVAGDVMARFYFLVFGNLGAATLGREGTPGVEGAA